MGGTGWAELMPFPKKELEEIGSRREMNTDSLGHRDIFQIELTSTTQETHDHNRKKPSTPPKAFLVDVGLRPHLMAENQGPGSAS